MKAQFKYAAKHALSQRGIALCATALICAVFTLLGATGVAAEGVLTLGVVLASLSLAAVFAVNIIADISSFSSIFGSSQGYLNMLTPVKSWKIILARLVTCAVEDIAALAIAISALVVQTFVLDESLENLFRFTFNWEDFRSLALASIMIFMGYLYLLMVVVFGMSLKSSIFAGMRGGTILGVLGALAAAWVLNLLNITLAPMGTHSTWGIFYNITLGSRVDMAAYEILTLVKTTMLFLASGALVERRINL